ncbi:2-oxoglutarate dehydrogenase E1 [Oscillospiraceae bacterium 50-16]
MKAITIWQPWANLLPLDIKQYETRSWETSYRGPIAIHAATRPVQKVLKECFPKDEDKAMLFAAIHKYLKEYRTAREVLDLLSNFPTGSVVAVANLVGCQKIIAPFGDRPQCFGNTPFIKLANGDTYTPDDVELALGDWTPGRYAWEFSDMKAITPIQAKGKQGLWEWEGGGLNV